MITVSQNQLLRQLVLLRSKLETDPILRRCEFHGLAHVSSRVALVAELQRAISEVAA